MQTGLPITFEKNGLLYKTYVGLNEMDFLIKEYYKKYEKCDAKVLPLSAIESCGIDENGRAIIKGCTAFSVSYIRGINPYNGKKIVIDEWIEESNITAKIKKIFDDYGLEIKSIDFHNNLFLKKSNLNVQISEQEASNYSTDDLKSEFTGATVVFKKKKIKDKVMSLVFRNKKNN